MPCSLDPLPDESLPGFLLRLAHRLERSPARILQLTGLIDNRHGYARRTTHELMVRLAPAMRDDFAQATRLTPAEASDLCLEALAPRFPVPPEQAGPFRSRQQRSDWWLFTAATRYCPLCLAGDGSAIQQAHGGAWRRSWRLPITFACLQHCRFLEHRCPGCGDPPHTVAGGRGSILLQPANQISGLHPAQCRTRQSGTGPAGTNVCGHRFDIPTLPATELPQDAYAFQQRLADLLHPDGPPMIDSAGRPTTPARYFTDLRILSGLVSFSWPAAQDLVPSPDLAAALDRQIEAHRRRQAKRSGVQNLSRPEDPMAACALLTIADTILRHNDVAQVRSQVKQLLRFEAVTAAKRGGGGLFLMAVEKSAYSPGLRDAVDPLLHVYARERGPNSKRASELHPAFGPQHIPQRLPDNWADQHIRHLTRLTSISPLSLRRTLAARLVQMITGGSLGDAAHYLGLPTRPNDKGQLIFSPGKGFRSCFNSLPDPHEFDHAVRAIAEAMNHTAPLINYHQRRLALAGWLLDKNACQQIARTLDRIPVTRGDRWQSSDLRRHCLSTAIWARATSGESTLAPHPLQDRQAKDVQRWWARSTSEWTRQQRENTTRTPRSTALETWLTTYTDHLTKCIDAGVPATECQPPRSDAI